MLTLKNPFVSNHVKRHRDYIDELFGSSVDLWGTLFNVCDPLQYMGFTEYDNGTATFSVDVPGMKVEDLDISIDKNIVTVKGERKDIRRPAKINTSFSLPSDYDAESLSAKLEDGVMILTVRKLPSEKNGARKIEIQSIQPKLLEKSKD